MLGGVLHEILGIMFERILGGIPEKKTIRCIFRRNLGGMTKKLRGGITKRFL